MVVSDINDDKGQETVELITGAGGMAVYTHTDSSSLEQNQALVKFAVDTYGQLVLAVNNAGVAPPATPLADVDADRWNRIISIDLTGASGASSRRSQRC